jgi:hypothetical protein
MTNDTFNELVEELLEYVKSTLTSKGDMYARGATDRLVAFKVMGRRLDKTPMEALEGAREKHSTSVHMMIKDHAAGHPWPYSVWREKAGDELIYNILLLALVKEGIEGQLEEERGEG